MAACCTASGVAAQTPDESLFLRRDDLRIVPFASVDLGRSIFVTTGLKQSLTGPLDRQGYVLMETFGYGLTRERGDPRLGSIYRHTIQTSTLAGYQFAMHNIFVSAFVGPEMAWEQVTYGGQVEQWSRPRLGARVQGEVWAQPGPDILITGTIVLGSTQGSIWSRVSAGYRIWRNIYAGPEAAYYATDTYHESRIGGHITGAQFGRVDMRASAGMQTQDDERRPSGYFSLSGYFKM